MRDFGRVLVDRKWIVITAVLVSTIASVLMSALQTQRFAAEAEVLILPVGQQGVFEQTERINDRAIRTEIQVMEGEALRTRVQQDLGLAEEPPDVKASSVSGTDVIALALEDTDAQNAALLVNTYAEKYIEMRREQALGQLQEATVEIQAAIESLQAQVDSLPRGDPNADPLAEQLASFKANLDQLRVDIALTSGDASIINAADVPQTPIEPRPARNAALAAIVGLLLGIGAAFFVDYLDDRVRTEDDLASLTDEPVLAVVPTDHPPDSRPIALSQPADSAVEAYRGLRTNLQFRGLDEILRVVQVTSSLPGEGKTTTVANLAVVLAQAGHRVAVVDADLRRPQIHETFGVAQSPGLTDLLLGAAPREIVNHVPISDGYRISVYCSGVAPSNPSEMLGGRRMRQLLTDMGGHYDFVIVDSAPVLPVTDSVALANAVDGVLVVVHAGEVDRGNVNESVERLQRVSAPLLGFVLNRSDTSGFDAYSSTAYAVAPQAVIDPIEDNVAVEA